MGAHLKPHRGSALLTYPGDTASVSLPSSEGRAGYLKGGNEQSETPALPQPHPAGGAREAELALR